MNMMEKAVKALRRITASRNHVAKEKIKIRFLVLFPAWEKNIPTLGNNYSQIDQGTVLGC